MRFHDGSADAKSHAGAMRFDGKEGVEDLVRLLRRHPTPVSLIESFAVGDRYFEEIRFRFLEETKVCTPRHVADDVGSGLPHLRRHRGYLSNFILKNG
jgi:hypothetical protein